MRRRDRAVAVVAFAVAGIAILGSVARTLDEPTALPPSLLQAAVGVAGLRCGQPIAGSGVVVGGPTGPVVVTAAHVAAGLDDLEVVDQDGQGHGAEVVAFDLDSDLAALSAPTLASEPTRIRRRDDAIGAIATVDRSGDLGQMPFAVRRAVRANVSDVPSGLEFSRRALELDASVSLGDSGAGLFVPGGDVVGILWANSRQHDNRAWAIDAGEIRRLLTDITSTPVTTGDPC